MRVAPRLDARPSGSRAWRGRPSDLWDQPLTELAQGGRSLDMESPTTSAPLGGTCEHHLVEFYETDAFLAATVADFAVPALRDWDSVIVIATHEHRRAFAAAIRAEGIDLDAAQRDGRYQAVDARELL